VNIIGTTKHVRFSIKNFNLKTQSRVKKNE